MTKHTCTADGRALPFGKKAPAGMCPRCDELRNGAPARDSWHRGAKERDARFLASVRNHNCQLARCGPVCTFGDW